MYTDIFENEDLFLRFQKNTRPRSACILIAYVPQHENAKRWKYNSILYRACAM